MDHPPLELATPLTLPCGLTIPNRLAKAAMAEAWADKQQLPQADMIETYGHWAQGDWGLVLTGNVQVDMAQLGQREDVAVNDAAMPRASLLAAWTRWAAAASQHGTRAVVQLNHPGRQSIPGAGSHGYLGKTLAPSAVPVRLGDGLLARLLSRVVFGTPRAMTADDIAYVVRRFAEGARLAHDAGFAGVEVHAAHGYLLAQFLSARTNRRTDEYGGSPRKRARIVVEVVRAIRDAVPASTGFCVGVKFNSVDHQSPDALDACVEQLQDIAAAGIDFLEISGGTYEDPSVSPPSPLLLLPYLLP